MSVGTYSAWESTATLRLLGGGGGEGRGHIVSPCAQLVVFVMLQSVVITVLLKRPAAHQT